MTDQPPSDRFKSEMPQIPGVSGPGSRATTAPNPAVKLVLGLLAVLLVVFLGARWALRPKHAAPQSVDQQPQIEVPSPAPDPSTLLPHATDAEPGIAEIGGMGKRSEEHTSELQSLTNLVCRLLLEKKKRKQNRAATHHTKIRRIVDIVT